MQNKINTKKIKPLILLFFCVAILSYSFAQISYQNKVGSDNYTILNVSSDKNASVSGTSHFYKMFQTWDLYNPKEKKCYTMRAVQLGVTFKVKAINKTTNQNICNQTLTVGDKIRLQFLPHKGSDACWNTTGFSLDSPCGEFKDKAAPPADLNATKYILDNTSLGRYSTGIVTTPFMIDPPTKTITGIDGMSCTKINSSDYDCTITDPGKYNIRFNIDDTIAKTYTNLNIQTSAVGGGTQLRAGSSGLDRTVFGGNTCSGPKPVQIPSSYINCPINVADDGGESSKPTFPIVTNSNSTNSCILSESTTISITSNNNVRVKFGIDWDNNGTIDSYTSFVDPDKKVTASYTFSGTPGNRTIGVIAVDSQNKVSTKTLFNLNCQNEEVKTCANGAVDAPYCKVCLGGVTLADSSQMCPKSCNYTNACGQVSSGNLINNVCTATSEVTNNTCVTDFKVSTDRVGPNGAVDFSWRIADLPTGVSAKCGFVDLTTPTPRPIPGLQNLDQNSDSATIRNIQNTTRYCLICKFLKNEIPQGEVINHQWVRVIRIGEGQ